MEIKFLNVDRREANISTSIKARELCLYGLEAHELQVLL